MAETWKFGDVIMNGWASERNPQRFGYFVRRGTSNAFVNGGTYVELTDGRNNFWRHSTKGEHRLSKVDQATLPILPQNVGHEQSRTDHATR
jgi:hypothetical protein